MCPPFTWTRARRHSSFGSAGPGLPSGGGDADIHRLASCEAFQYFHGNPHTFQRILHFVILLQAVWKPFRERKLRRPPVPNDIMPQGPSRVKYFFKKLCIFFAPSFSTEISFNLQLYFSAARVAKSVTPKSALLKFFQKPSFSASFFAFPRYLSSQAVSGL